MGTTQRKVSGKKQRGGRGRGGGGGRGSGSGGGSSKIVTLLSLPFPFFRLFSSALYFVPLPTT